ncbi:MAG TPA: sugar ABC transporter permease [Clostridiales bacterium]|nr:sugar ABC transporter permease [Clostridiales bacterium]
MSSTRKLQLIGGLFSLPALIIVTFSTIIPVIWNIVLSFSKWDGITSMSFVGIENFIKVFSDKASMKAMGYSLVIAVIATATAMFLGILLSLLIYKVTKVEGALFRFVFYSPVMLPLSVVGLLFTLVLATDEGLLNNILGLIGLANLQNAWLAKKGMVLVVIGLVQGWRSSGTVMMLVFTGIIGLPVDLFESSKLDGATYRQEIRYIILPLVKPTIQLALSMCVMSAFKTYDIVFSMTGGGPGDISKTAPLKILEQAFMSNKYGVAAANSVIYAGIVITILAILRKGIGGEKYEY